MTKSIKNIIKIDGRRIEYFVYGKGKPLILIPGLGCDCSVWKYLIPYLKKHFRIFTFSLPLYGTHNNLGHIYTLHTFPDLLKKFITLLHIRKPILVGHSLGSLIAVFYAVKHPKSIEKLILVSAPLSCKLDQIPVAWRWVIGTVLKNKKVDSIIEYLTLKHDIADYMMKIIKPKRNIDEKSVSIREFIQTVPIRSMAKCYHDIFNSDLSDIVKKVKISVLIIYGQNDMILQNFKGTSLYPFIKNSEIVGLPADHFIASQCPELLADLILKYTRGISINSNSTLKRATFS